MTEEILNPLKERPPFTFTPLYPPAEDESLDDLLHGGFILQKKKGYRFSLDAVVLANWAFTKAPRTVADIGCGCGIIPLLLYRRFGNTEITGIELQESLFRLAEKNTANNGAASRIKLVQGDVKELAPQLKKTFDAVTANPPFFKIGQGKPAADPEKRRARSEESLTLPELFAAATRLLHVNGNFALVHRAERLPEILTEAEKQGFNTKRLCLVHPNAQKAASLFLWEGTLKGKSTPIIEKPLFIYQEDGQYTPEFLALYGL